MISIPMRMSANPTVPMSLNSNSPIPMNFSTAINQRVALSDEAKEALLNCFAHVAWIDEDGQDYYDALYDALYSTPPATLVSISAVYTQSGTVYTTTSLDDLKTDLVVTATYDDSSTATVTTYTLSGTLEVGTSTVTVSYGGKTTTFTVTVSAIPTVSSISAVYTQSGTVYWNDSLDSLKDDLVVTATYADSSTAVIPSTDYTLSGTLTLGTTSTITVSYSGKTTTFNVVVSDIVYLLGADDFGTADYPIGGLANYYSATGVVNYQAVASKTRLAYIPFDLTIIGGHTYELTLDTDVSTASITCTYYNQTALDAVAVHGEITTGNYSDGSWPSGKVYTVTPPTTLNNSPVVCIRISVRKSSSNPTITTNLITSVTIRDVTT